MLLFFFILSFTLYSLAFYFYATKLFGRSTKIQYGIASLFNAFLYIYYIFYVSFEYEYIAIVALFLIYIIQVKLIFKQNYLTILFRALTLTLHVIAMRMIVIGSFALMYDMPIYELARNQELRILTSTVFFFIAFPYVFIVRAIFIKINFVSVLKDGKSIAFSIYVLTAIFLYCVYTVGSLYPATFPEVKLIYVVIKTGACSLVGFFLCFTYEYVFTNLRWHQNKYQALSEALEQGEKDLEQLSYEASVDAFTGLKVRDVAYTRLEHFLSDNEPFYAIFLDMNGLKTVNDQFGHAEGDFYILQTVEILKNIFNRETVTRLGGDEFFVIGKLFDGASPRTKIEKLLYEVDQIAKIHHKKYETSISYGIALIDGSEETSNITPDEIIKLADERMYQYKKVRNLQRSVIVPEKS